MPPESWCGYFVSKPRKTDNPDQFLDVRAGLPWRAAPPRHQIAQ